MNDRTFKLGMVAVWVAGSVGFSAVGETGGATFALVIALAVLVLA